MNVYLLPHHRLDPRFQYTLEREAPPGPGALLTITVDLGDMPTTWLGRQVWRFRHLLRKLKHDYDQVVHGHEHIRLSRLLLLMDRDPELTLVIPAGMTRESALEAVRGVIRVGQMALRSHAVRNVSTALLMFIILFLVLPLHFTAIIFLPLLVLYAWLRYWEDRLIRRTMNHLLEARLAGDGGGRFREEKHLARLEEIFGRAHRPGDAYREAAGYLDGLDQRIDGQSTPEHALMFKYYRDVGRFDPYERYQDRIRKKLGEALKLVGHHLWAFWKGAFLWIFARSRVWGLRVPNWVFVVAVLGVINVVLWGALRLWGNRTAETGPPTIRSAEEPPPQAARL